MIVGACGFGATGSSAITDYLNEFDNVQIVGSTEFDWVWLPDGLIDLEYHLKHSHGRYSDSYKAIERFFQVCEKKAYTMQRFGVNSDNYMNSVNRFIESITQSEWVISYNLPPCTSLVEKIYRKLLLKSGYITKWEASHKTQWEKYPYRKIKFSANPKNFDELAKNHVMELIGMMGVNMDRPIVFDQPFSGENPQACFKYFDDPYAIVVDRDPRDLFISGKVLFPGKYVYHIMPLNDVKAFVSFYRGLRDNQPYKEKHERVLSLQLGDMIYRYDETTAKIREFLNLPENPHPKSIFDPALSMANTQLWLRYPQFEKEAKYIEQELPEYLYDYSNCPKPSADAIIFDDRSPKAKI